MSFSRATQALSNADGWLFSLPHDDRQRSGTVRSEYDGLFDIGRAARPRDDDALAAVFLYPAERAAIESGAKSGCARDDDARRRQIWQQSRGICRNENDGRS